MCGTAHIFPAGSPGQLLFSLPLLKAPVNNAWAHTPASLHSCSNGDAKEGGLTSAVAAGWQSPGASR